VLPVNGDVQDPSGCTFNGATVDRLIISNIKKYNSKIDLSGGTFNEVDIDLSVFMGRSGYNIIFGDAVINTSLSIEGLVSGLDLSQATIPSGTSIGSSQSYKDTRMLSSKIYWSRLLWNFYFRWRLLEGLTFLSLICRL